MARLNGWLDRVANTLVDKALVLGEPIVGCDKIWQNLIGDASQCRHKDEAPKTSKIILFRMGRKKNTLMCYYKVNLQTGKVTVQLKRGVLNLLNILPEL